MVRSLRNTDFESSSPGMMLFQIMVLRTERCILTVKFHIDLAEQGLKSLEGHLRCLVQCSPKLYF